MQLYNHIWDFYFLVLYKMTKIIFQLGLMWLLTILGVGVLIVGLVFYLQKGLYYLIVKSREIFSFL